MNFTYNGKETFKTTIGASATYVITFLILAYTVVKAKHLILRDNPRIMLTQNLRDDKEFLVDFRP